MYRDYADAFTRVSGLPLSLHAPGMTPLVHYGGKHQNPFCRQLAKLDQWCTSSHTLQCELEKQALIEPKTLKGFAGMCETAVPVRVDDKLIAFLQTGQILLDRPDQAQFDKIARQLVEWGASVDLKRLEEAFFNTRVLTRRQYESLIRLLTIFAKHLASSANTLLLAHVQAKAPMIEHARHYIHDHFGDKLSLVAVARTVNMSPSGFSRQFKQATGMNFVQYVALARVEEARDLLKNPHARISEIAFAVGFQSLSQFNRAFKQVIGQSPREYRESHAV